MQSAIVFEGDLSVDWVAVNLVVIYLMTCIFEGNLSRISQFFSIPNILCHKTNVFILENSS